MVVPILQYIRKCQFSLSVSSDFYMTKHVETKVYTKYLRLNSLRAVDLYIDRLRGRQATRRVYI